MPAGAQLALDPDSGEDQYGWFTPAEAADKLAVKYDADFCRLIANVA